MATGSIAKAPGHVFYERLNALLREAGFDRFVEGLVAPYYASGGRPGIAPGVLRHLPFASAICWIPAVVGIFRHMVLAVSDRFVLSRAINQRDFRRSHQTTSLCFSTDC